MSTLEPELSLWRHGHLYRLERRLGVARGDARDPLRQTALFALVAWMPQLVLGAVEAVRRGQADTALWLGGLEGAARWLVAVPLVLLGMRAIARESDRALRHLVTTGIVSDVDHDRLARVCRRLVWLRDWWAAEVVMLGVAWALGEVGERVFSLAPPPVGLAGAWMTWVALPLFRYLLLRWLWQWALWAAMLWWLSRLDLRLHCSHPDRVAGLRFLVRPSRRVALIGLGLSALSSATWAVQIAGGQVRLAGLIDIATFYVAVLLCVALAPLLVLMRPLRHAIITQYHGYDALARAQAVAFDARWLSTARGVDQTIDQTIDPGHPDFSGLADYGAVIERIQQTKLVPFALGDATFIAVAALVPLAPLVLFEVPLDSLMRRLFEVIV